MNSSRPPMSSRRRTDAAGSTNNSVLMSARLASAHDAAMRTNMREQVAGRDKLTDDHNEINWGGSAIGEKNLILYTDEAASVIEPSLGPTDGHTLPTGSQKFNSQMGSVKLQIGQINAKNVVINVSGLERALSTNGLD